MCLEPPPTYVFAGEETVIKYLKYISSFQNGIWNWSNVAIIEVFLMAKRIKSSTQPNLMVDRIYLEVHPCACAQTLCEHWWLFRRGFSLVWRQLLRLSWGKEMACFDCCIVKVEWLGPSIIFLYIELNKCFFFFK